MNTLSGPYCFSHRSFSTTKLPLRKSICSRKSYPYLKQVIFFIFLKYGEYVYAVHTIYMYNRDSDVQIVSNDDFRCEIFKKRFGSKEKVRIFAARFGKRGLWDLLKRDGELFKKRKNLKKILEVLKKLLPLQPRSKRRGKQKRRSLKRLKD